MIIYIRCIRTRAEWQWQFEDSSTLQRTALANKTRHVRWVLGRKSVAPVRLRETERHTRRADTSQLTFMRG